MSIFSANALSIPLAPPHSVRVDLALEKGDVLLLRGPSGSGKTTTLRTLARLRAPASGELLLGDKARSSIAPSAWRRRVAYLPQRPVMLAGTVERNLAAGFAPRGLPGTFHRPKAQEILRSLGLDHAIDERDAALISGGEASRVALCRALLLQPEVLLCDEITAGLDAENAARAVAVVADSMHEGAAVVVAHDPACWRACEALEGRLREQALEVAS